MAITLSTSTVNALGMKCSLQEIFQGGELQIWSGTEPAVGSAATGTRLVSCTLASAARTAEVQATALLSLTGGAAGSVDTITIATYNILGAAVAYNTSLTQTAADVATQINKYSSPILKVWATSSGADITIRACPGQGTGLNALAMVCTSTTITTTINGVSADNMGEGAGGSTAGVASANGLTFLEIASGVLSKSATAWSGVVAATGTAGYWRLEGCNTPINTSLADATATPRYRIQGTCGLSGSDMTFGSTTLTAGLTHTVDTFSITIPAS